MPDSIVFPEELIVDGMALVGAVCDEAGELGPCDKQWKACAQMLCRQLGIHVSAKPEFIVVNKNRGHDYLDPDFQLTAAASVICGVHNPHDGVLAEIIARQSPHFAASEHHATGAWEQAALRAGSKIVITMGSPFPNALGAQTQAQDEISARDFGAEQPDGAYVLAYEVTGLRTHRFDIIQNRYLPVKQEDEFQKNTIKFMQVLSGRENLSFDKAARLLGGRQKRHYEAIKNMLGEKKNKNQGTGQAILEELIFAYSNQLRSEIREKCFCAQLLFERSLAENICRNNRNARQPWLRHMRMRLGRSTIQLPECTA